MGRLGGKVRGGQFEVGWGYYEWGDEGWEVRGGR